MAFLESEKTILRRNNWALIIPPQRGTLESLRNELTNNGPWPIRQAVTFEPRQPIESQGLEKAIVQECRIATSLSGSMSMAIRQ